MMKQQIRPVRLGLILVAAMVLAVTVLLSGRVGSASEDVKPCCFTNDRYSGVCKVFPSGDETCGDILAYLNNPMATGKNYCGNTQIRGGWRQVDCK